MDVQDLASQYHWREGSNILMQHTRLLHTCFFGAEYRSANANAWYGTDRAASS